MLTWHLVDKHYFYNSLSTNPKKNRQDKASYSIYNLLDMWSVKTFQEQRIAKAAAVQV